VDTQYIQDNRAYKNSAPVEGAEDGKPETTTVHLSKDGEPILINILINEMGRNVATFNLEAGRNTRPAASRRNNVEDMMTTC